AYFGVSLTFAASAMYDGFGNLPGMYREAEARLACKFFYGSGVIGLDEERNAAAVMREKLAQLYSFGDLARLPEALLWENYKAKADDMINGLSPDPAAVKDALCVLLHWLSRQLYLNGDEDYAKLVSYEQTLSQAETLDDALEEVKRYIALLNHALRARKQLRPEITAALQFIGEHYKNNLSLRDVARHVGLSPSYFSTLFKKEIDVTMTEYLNALRIDEAKRLLRETDMKTYEVSEAAGFWESTYFNALFKRLTGVTPYKYREQWQAAGAEADKP
ncbi:MAG: AraC family transcriptional regulator, partial [Defluviitaleaceae bacterium]|nr:AraC family transcriptional regulator [Defluviitaleaceae bacterium]